MNINNAHNCPDFSTFSTETLAALAGIAANEIAYAQRVVAHPFPAPLDKWNQRAIANGIKWSITRARIEREMEARLALACGL